jgi:hypothetical protein
MISLLCLRLKLRMEPPFACLTGRCRPRWRARWRVWWRRTGARWHAANADLAARHGWYRVWLHIAAAMISGRNLRWHFRGILRELRRRPRNRQRNHDHGHHD